MVVGVGSNPDGAHLDSYTRKFTRNSIESMMELRPRQGHLK